LQEIKLRKEDGWETVSSGRQRVATSSMR